MFIVIEHRSHHHKTVSLTEEVCPLCQEKGLLKLHIMQKYQHMIGPLTPLPKYAVLECDACDKTIPNNKWNKKFDEIYRKEKADIKTPARMWRGMWVLPLLFLAIMGAIKISTLVTQNNRAKNEAQTRNWIENAKVGDVLFVSSGTIQTQEDLETIRGIVQIAKISGDTIFIKTHPKRWGVQVINKDISTSDFDAKEFSQEMLPMKLSSFKKNKVLVHLNSNSEENDKVYASVKGFIE